MCLPDSYKRETTEKFEEGMFNIEYECKDIIIELINTY